jgi:hypothetical protein
MQKMKRLPNIGTLVTGTHSSAYGNCKLQHLDKLQILIKITHPCSNGNINKHKKEIQNSKLAHHHKEINIFIW